MTHTTPSWTVARLFEQLANLSPLRIITVSGPSVFEAICSVGPFGVAGGYLNAMTTEYHWHLELQRCRYLRTRDEVHSRSGRRVLFFELAEELNGQPFVSIYLHRGKGEDFGPQRLMCFETLHQQLAEGITLAPELSS